MHFQVYLPNSLELQTRENSANTFANLIFQVVVVKHTNNKPLLSEKIEFPKHGVKLQSFLQKKSAPRFSSRIGVNNQGI